MKTKTNTNFMKKIADFFLRNETYSSGDNSEFFIAKEGKESKFKYIAQCIEKAKLEKRKKLIEYSINNSKLYASTNCIVIFKTIHQTNNNLYLFYNFFDSYSLSQFISQPPPNFSTIQDKLYLAFNIAIALNKLHNTKLMHRNLNPSHILISKNDFSRILFCGVTSIYNFAQSYPSKRIGNDHYMAPEMIQSEINGGTYDEKVDIYSFGVILYELFTGSFDLTKLYIDISKIKGLPIGIQKLILDCLLIDSKRRISSSEILKLEYFKDEKETLIILNSIFSMKTVLNSINLNIDNRNILYPYQETCLLGEGSFGKALKVINIETNIHYAMKIIKLVKLSGNKKAKNIIYREIKLLYFLNDINFVIDLIDVFHYNHNLYEIFEFCNGGCLDRRVKDLYKKKSHLTIEEIKLVARNLAKGLLEIHKKKYNSWKFKT